MIAPQTPNQSKSMQQKATADPEVHPLDLPEPESVSLRGNDQPDPQNWDVRYKWLLAFILSGQSLTTNLTLFVCAPAIPSMLQEFAATGTTDGTLIVTIWNLGAILGSLCSGPLSELYGRQIVYNVANLLCLAVLVGQSLARSFAMVLVFRCLNGFFVVSAVLNTAMVGDLFVVEQRGRAQSLLSLMPQLGPVVGPIAGGAISSAKGWRWSFWFNFFVLAAFTIAFVVFYRETYLPRIVARSASRHSCDLEEQALRAGGGSTSKAQSQKPGILLRQAVSRQIRVFPVPVFLILVLSTTPVTLFSYVVAANIAAIFEDRYNFSETSAGLTFLGMAVGMMLAALFCAFVLDSYTQKMQKRNNGHVKPEWRLPPILFGLMICSLGMFLYGWSLEKRFHFMVPIVANGLVGFGSYVATIPAITYLADTFGSYRASAMSGLTIFRNAVGVGLPLAGPPLYQKLGFGWGNSIFALYALLMVPAVLLLARFGESMRQRSKLDTWR